MIIRKVETLVKTTARFETKFRLSQSHYYQVRNELLGAPMEADIYSREQAYLVKAYILMTGITKLIVII